MTRAAAKLAAENERNPVGRALKLITFLADNDPTQPCGVREIAGKLGLPVSAAHRVLSGLKEEGWLEQSGEEGDYYLSLEVFRLALALSSKLPLTRVALPVMQDLVAECNETALLGLFDSARLEMSFVAQVESRHPLRYAIDLHRWGPIHAGATGQAIFAFLPEAMRERIIAHMGLPPVTSRTITDADRMRENLAAIRERGYAITRGQRITGSVGIAAPIFAPDGSVIGDLAVTLPEQRFLELGTKQDLAQSVMRYAKKITEKLRQK